MPWHSLLIGARALSANPLRTALAALGVIVGTGALVAVLAIADGVEAFARRQIAETTDLQLVHISSRTNRTLDGLTLPRPDTLRLTETHLTTLRTALGDIGSATLRFSGGATLGGFPDDSARGTEVISLEDGPPVVEENALMAGRWLSIEEVRDSSAVAVISMALASRLTRSTDYARALGRRITLEGTSVEIVGVTAKPASPQMIAWVPRTRFAGLVAQPLSRRPSLAPARGIHPGIHRRGRLAGNRLDARAPRR